MWELNKLNQYHQSFQSSFSVNTEYTVWLASSIQLQPLHQIILILGYLSSADFSISLCSTSQLNHVSSLGASQILIGYPHLLSFIRCGSRG